MIKIAEKRTIVSIFIFLCMSATGFAFRTEAPQVNKNAKPATIKVLLEKNLEGALLEVKGSYKVVDPLTNKRLSSGSRGKRFFVFPMQDGLKWGEEYPGTFQISILPTSSEMTFLLNGTQYRGGVYVYLIDGKLQFVNETDVEHYLKVTLAHMLPEKTHSAVRDAVAIIARTDAYFTALANYDSYWHVEKTAAGYDGYAKAFSDIEAARSVENTRHLVMTYDSQPFAASWTENSAGRTASYQTIFRKNIASPKGVETPYAEKGRRDSEWRYSLASSELATLLKINRVSELDLFVDQRSRKVYGLRIKDGSHIKDVGIVALQSLLGASNIQSSEFNVELKNGKISFTGVGKGLGTGLCLYSATMMAEKGELAPRILADFFPLTHLEKMRSYPEMIISPSKEYFIAPVKKRTMLFEEKDPSLEGDAF